MSFDINFSNLGYIILSKVHVNDVLSANFFQMNIFF